MYNASQSRRVLLKWLADKGAEKSKDTPFLPEVKDTSPDQDLLTRGLYRGQNQVEGNRVEGKEKNLSGGKVAPQRG